MQLATNPKTCNHCYNPVRTVYYDAKTPSGPWAYLCHSCFTDMGLKYRKGGLHIKFKMVEGELGKRWERVR